MVIVFVDNEFCGLGFALECVITSVVWVVIGEWFWALICLGIRKLL